MLKSVSIFALLCIASPALAQEEFGFSGDDFAYESPDYHLQLRGSVGMMGIEGREHVLAGDDNVSLLTWQTLAPVASVDVKARLDDNWTLSASFRAALGGKSYMEDYDWLAPYAPSYAADDWSDRSQHPDTKLDWFYDATIALGKDLPANESLTINLNGGFKYTDVQWTARGGSYVYSTGGFRDDAGNFPDAPGITYRQQLPTLFAGLDADAHSDGWTIGLAARGGVTFLGKATDNHWMRDRLFIDSLAMTPMASATGSAGYDISDHLNVYVEASIEKVFMARGDTEIYNTNTNALIGTAPDSAGAELGTATLSAGLKGSF